MSTTSTNSTRSSLLLENMDEVKKVFNCFDSNGDGKISSDELANVLRALGSITSDEEVNEMMAEIDKDGDGFIDLDEFAEFHRSAPEGFNDAVDGGVRELKDAFDLYDKDQNGLISASELHLVLKSLGEQCSLQDCGKMIDSVDSDGDGFVNFQEFQEMMKAASQSQ